MKRRRWLSFAVVCLSLAGLAFGWAGSASVADISFYPPMAAAGLVGAWLLVRVPDNRVGWVLAAIGIAGFVLGAAASIEMAAGHSGVGIVAAAIPAAMWGVTMLLIMILIPLWFPTGRALTSRWEWIASVAILAAAVSALSGPFVATVCVDHAPNRSDCLVSLENPIGVGWAQAASVVAALVVAVLAIPAIASLVLRYRRAGGIERLQIRWVAYVFVLLIASFGVGFLPVDDSGGLFQAVYDILGSVGFLAIPVAIGVAVTRHRLYDIDRIINKTAVYAIVVGALALVFIAGVVWIPTLLDLGDSSLAVAASTLAVAALFNPLRRRVQRFVDHRFYRSRYDAQQVAERFSSQLRDEVDPDRVAHEWVGVVSQTMQPASASIWVREP